MKKILKSKSSKQPSAPVIDIGARGRVIDAKALFSKDVEQLTVLKEPIGFSQLDKRAKEIQSQCSDRYTHSSILSVSPEDLRLLTDGKNGKQLTRHSLAQLCTKAGIPMKYMDKCIENRKLGLVAENVNQWLGDMNKELMLRDYAGRVRGIMSNKYSPLDTPEILNGIKSALDDEYMVKSFLLNEERFHARLLSGEKIPVPKEDLFVGIEVDSSDVGKSMLRVQFMVYKQICTNGLKVNLGDSILFQQKHIGISVDKFQDELVANLEHIPMLTKEVAKLIKDSSTKLSKADIDKYIEKLMEEAKMGKDNAEKVIAIANAKYGMTKWGVINSITELAQQFTLDRRLELESFAGKILTA